MADENLEQPKEEGKQGAQGADVIAAAEAAKGDVTLFPEDDAELKRLQDQEQAERQAAAKTVAEAEAKAKADAAAKANAQPAAPANAGDKTGDKPGTAQPAAKPAQPAQQRDPKDGAIIALRKSLNETEAERLRLEGENRVLREMQQRGQPAPGEGKQDTASDTKDEGPKTVEEVNTAIITLAQEYDAGKITTADYKKRELELMDLKNDMVLQDRVATRPEPEDTVMTDHLDKLIGDYPMLKILSKEQLDPFYEQAIQQAAAEGKPIPQTNRGTIELRERMAKLATDHYLGVINAKAAASAQQPSQPAQPAARPGELSPQAKARAEKLELAGNHPPNISEIGAGSRGAELTEESLYQQLTAMGGDEEAQLKLIAANSAFVKNVMRNVTG